MKRLSVAAVIGLLVVANSWAATNYNSSKSNVYIAFPNGLITTATMNFATGAGGVVYTTPAEGDFVLTQFCADPNAAGGIRLTAANFGTIAQTVSGQGCYTFTPGVSIPPSTALTCSTSSPMKVTHFCTISGLQSNGSTPTATETATPIPAM